VVRLKHCFDKISKTTSSLKATNYPKKLYKHNSKYKKEKNMIFSQWLALLPASLVIILAIITKKVRLSLGIGIIAGILIATNGSPSAIIHLLRDIAKETFDINVIYTFLFLFLIGIFIQIINKTGAIQQYANNMLSIIKTNRSANLMTMILSSVLFVDEYLNNLTIGCVMAPILDTLKSTRYKLAYIINTTAASLCILIPASSWTAIVLLLIQGSGENPILQYTNMTSFMFYICMIPLFFYPIFSFINALILAMTDFPVGPIHREHVSPLKEVLCRAEAPSNSNNSSKALYIFYISFGLFLISVLTGFIITQNAIISLFFASTIAVLIASILALYNNILTIKDIINGITSGINDILPPAIVLLLAWILQSLFKYHLSTSVVVGMLLTQNIPLLLIPFTLFAVTALLSATVGSAWGAMMIVIPLASTLFNPQTMLLTGSLSTYILVSIASIISGSLAGSHISPISDLMVISSTSARVSLMRHTTIQTIYSIPVIIASVIAYLIATYLIIYTAHSYTIVAITSILAGLVVLLASFIIMRIYTKSRTLLTK
jgi:tetracycline resistance efflux pump